MYNFLFPVIWLYLMFDSSRVPSYVIHPTRRVPFGIYAHVSVSIFKNGHLQKYIIKINFTFR